MAHYNAAMSLFFTAPGLLWLLPLALLPVAFHIHARTKERAVDFPGAFFLVNPALPSAERRRQIEDIALLTLRVILLAAAVLALAGPRVKGWASAASDADPQAGREAVCVVLDDSPSLSLLQANGAGRESLPVTLSRLGQVLASDPRRRVALETTSGAGWPLQSAGAFSAQLGKTAWSSTLSGDRTMALTRGLTSIRDTGEDRRVVILYTDLFRNQAEGDDESLRSRWTAALKAFHQAESPALVVLTPQHIPARQWRVEFTETGTGAAAAERVPVAGQPFHARLRIRCLAGAGRRDLRVETALWRFDGGSVRENVPSSRVLERPVILADGQVADVEVPLLSTGACTQWVSASLSEPDEWPYDDSAETVVLVRPKRSAVLWDARRERPGRDVALQSVVFALDPLSGAEKSRVLLTRPAQPRAEDVQPGVLVAILCGPEGPRLSQGLSERLRGAVETGATILWVPDLTGDARSWGTPMPGRAIFSDPLLPRAIEGAEAQSSSAADAAWRIANAQTTHALLRPFAGGRNGDLPGVHFRRRLRLAIEPETGAQPGMAEHVLARFNDGLPALVIQRVGAGWSCQMAFGPESEGGLVESAAWPVLLSEFLELAADDGLGAASSLTVPPGLAVGRNWPIEPLSVVRTARLAEPWHPKPGELRTVPAQRWSMEVAPKATEIVLPLLRETGLYRLNMEGRDAQRFLACRAAPEESMTERLPEEVRGDIALAAQSSGGRVIHDVADLGRALTELQPGRPLAPVCWTIFALLMALELGLLIWRGKSG